MLEQREVLADRFTSLCLGSGIPARTTVSRRRWCIKASAERGNDKFRFREVIVTGPLSQQHCAWADVPGWRPALDGLV